MSDSQFYLITCDETRILRVRFPTAQHPARLEALTQNGREWICETIRLTEEEFHRMFPCTLTLPETIQYVR